MSEYSLIQFKRATTAVWNQHKDVILEQGEPAVEFTTDNKALLKIGDGLTPWETLGYEGGSGTPADLTNYLKKDLSNLPNFSTIAEGGILLKKSGEINASSLIETSTKIISSKTIEVPPNTLNLGTNISLHENGGFVENEVHSNGKNYLMIDYENSDTVGTTKPIYYQRGNLVVKNDMQPVSGTTMNNVTNFSVGNITLERETSQLYFKLVNAVTNFSIKITINGVDAAFYPNKSAWDGVETGMSLNGGEVSIPLRPHISFLAGDTIVINLKANQNINMLGNGTVPYYAIDYKPITRKPIALMEDIATSGGIPTLSTVLNAGNTANSDINMNNHKVNNVTELVLKDEDGTKVSTLKTSPFADFKIFDGNNVDFFTVTNQGEIYTNGVDLLTSAGANKFLSGDGTYKTITNLGTTLAFKDLTDVPQSYQGMAGKTLAVKQDTSGLEFVSQGTGGSGVQVAIQEGDTAYDASKLLFPFCNGMVDDSGTVTVNTSFVVTDENAEIVPDCSVIEVPTTSLLSAKQSQGNSNAAVLDFKGLPIDMGDTTPIVNSKYLRFPEATVVKTDDITEVHTAPQTTIDGTTVVGRTETFEFPTTGLISVESSIGNPNASIITSRGVNVGLVDGGTTKTATSLYFPQSSINVAGGEATIKTAPKVTVDGNQRVETAAVIEVPTNGLLEAEADAEDQDKLYLAFAGLPTKKLTTTPQYNAKELRFPQANVSGTIDGIVTVGTGNLVSKEDDELSSTVNTWTFGNGINVELAKNNPNAVVVTVPQQERGISFTNDDTQPINSTLYAYLPQARIEDGSTTDTKIIKTSIPISSGTDNFDDYKKINFNNDDFNVARDGTDNDKINIDFGGISAETNNVETPHIKVFDFDKDHFTLDTSTENLAKISIKNSQNNGFLAVYNHKQVITEANAQEVYRTTTLVPNSVVWQDEGVVYDKTSGLITLKYTGTNGEKQLFKIIARASVRRQLREADLGVYLYLINTTTNDYMQDINDETPIVNNTIKKELVSDDIEIATMVAITQDTSFKVVLKDDTPNKYIEVLDLAMGTSAIMVEKVNANNQPSNALANYERLTQQSMRFIKHEFTNNFENAQSLISTTPVAHQTVPDDTNLQKDGWLIYFQDEGTYHQNTAPDGSTPCFDMVDKTGGFGYYNIARVLDYEDTWALRGHEFKATVDRVEQSGEYCIVPIVWRKRINEYATKIITGMNNQGIYSTTDGWEVVDASKVVIDAPSPAETTASFTCAYTVPDDAVNVGFMLMPTKQQTLSAFKFTDFKLGCDPTFERWIIEYPDQAIEAQLKKDSKYVKYVQQSGTPYNTSEWYQIPNGTAGDNNYAPLYTGEAQSGGNADITRIYNSSSSDFQELHNKGKWRFDKDGKVTVHVKVPVGTDKFADASDHNTLRIGFVKDTGGGDILQGTPITNSLRDISISKSGHVWNDSVRTSGYANWTFTLDVKENDEFWLAINPLNVPRDSGNEGHIYSYPSGFVEFTFLENEYAINQLQNDLAEMKKLLRATSDAVANKVYIEAGYDTNNNKPTIEAKIDTTP